MSVIYTELARDLSGKICVGRIYPLYLAGLMDCAGVGDGVWEVYRHIQTSSDKGLISSSSPGAVLLYT